MFRVNVKSVNGGVYRFGAVFGSVEAAEYRIPLELRGLSCYWAVDVVDENEQVVRHGFRAGYNGTGERWTWRDHVEGASNC